MQYINFEEVRDIIIRNNINFLASAVTPWHAHGVDVCIKNLTYSGVEVRGLVLITSLPIKHYFIDETNFISGNCIFCRVNPKVMQGVVTEFKSLINIIFAPIFYNRQDSLKSVDIFLASPWNLDVYGFINLYQWFPFKKIGLMLFEEGLSTYFSLSNKPELIWHSVGDKPFISKLFSFCFRLVCKKITDRFNTKVSYINLNLLREARGILQPNDEAVACYKSIIAERITALDCSEFDYNVFDNHVIICTMAYPREGMRNGTDIRTIKQIIQSLQAEAYKVIIKPHPRELDYMQYYADIGCEVFAERGVSIETILYKAKNVKAVISFSSTALVTAKLLFGIRAISIVDIVEWENYNCQIQQEMQSFKECFAGMTSIPKTINELVKTIS